jgi:hypothetical protein
LFSKKSRVNNFVFTSTGFTYRHGDRPDEVKPCPDMVIKCNGGLVSAFTAKRETAKTFFEKLFTHFLFFLFVKSSMFVGLISSSNHVWKQQ